MDAASVAEKALGGNINAELREKFEEYRVRCVAKAKAVEGKDSGSHRKARDDRPGVE